MAQQVFALNGRRSAGRVASRALSLVALLALVGACGSDDNGGGDGPERNPDAGRDTGGQTDTAIEPDVAPGIDVAPEDTTPPDVAPPQDVTPPEDVTLPEDVSSPQDVQPPMDVPEVPDTTETPDTSMDAPPDPTLASMAGNVTRSAEPAAGGRGNLYIAVLDADPVTSFGSANLVAMAVIESVDMSASGVSIPYRIDNIPLRAQAYYVNAFLDDNNNAAAGDRPGPDRGDLVSLNGFSSPTITLSTAGEKTLNIVLSSRMPF